MKKIVLLILSIVVCTTTFSQPAKSKKIAAFENFPTEANPLEGGKRLAERFMALPHSTFGAFKPTPPPMITYPDACTWYGNLQFAKNTGDKDLQQRRGNGWLAAGISELLSVVIPVADRIGNIADHP